MGYFHSFSPEQNKRKQPQPTVIQKKPVKKLLGPKKQPKTWKPKPKVEEREDNCKHWVLAYWPFSVEIRRNAFNGKFCSVSTGISKLASLNSMKSTWNMTKKDLTHEVSCVYKFFDVIYISQLIPRPQRTHMQLVRCALHMGKLWPLD